MGRFWGAVWFWIFCCGCGKGCGEEEGVVVVWRGGSEAEAGGEVEEAVGVEGEGRAGWWHCDSVGEGMGRRRKVATFAAGREGLCH